MSPALTPHEMIPFSVPGAAARFLHPDPALLSSDRDKALLPVLADSPVLQFGDPPDTPLPFDRPTALAVARWLRGVRLSEGGFGGGRLRGPASIEDACRIVAWIIGAADSRPVLPDGTPYTAQLRRAAASMLTAMGAWRVVTARGRPLTRVAPLAEARAALASAGEGARLRAWREAAHHPGPDGTGGKVVYLVEGEPVTEVTVPTAHKKT